MTADVAIIGGGPGGAICAAFCATAGLRVIVIERERFPREKVCGDCLNPACWPVLGRLRVAERVRQLPHATLDFVQFIAIGGRSVRVRLPEGDDREIAVKRSLFDELLLKRARELGAVLREGITATAISRHHQRRWLVRAGDDEIETRFVVAADGRNSTIARLLGVLPRVAKERVALQAHIPLPRRFANRVVLQLLPDGYSGQAPVNETELNLCLVGRAATLPRLREWAATEFELPLDQPWRTITPLTRDAISPEYSGVFFVGDAARVVEPFTGEGIFYAIRSGELAAQAISEIANGASETTTVQKYLREHAGIYRGRLWINYLSRAAVLSPRFASAFLKVARFQPAILRALTAKITQ
jgi:geranylgeranyl reductase family protein